MFQKSEFSQKKTRQEQTLTDAGSYFNLVLCDYFLHRGILQPLMFSFSKSLENNILCGAVQVHHLYM